MKSRKSTSKMTARMSCLTYTCALNQAAQLCTSKISGIISAVNHRCVLSTRPLYKPKTPSSSSSHLISYKFKTNPIYPRLGFTTMDMEKLNYDIFSILENKFLFDSFSPPQTPVKSCSDSTLKTPISKYFNYGGGGKIRILSIDAAEDVLPASAAIATLESHLRSISGLPTATIADFFDAAAGSGNGGVLAAMLFTKRSSDGKPLFSAEEASAFLTKNKMFKNEKSGLTGLFSKKYSQKKFDKIFRNEETLRDTVKPFLIPCYDLVTRSPFVFSRSDAVESDGYDFRMSDVCAATCAVHTVGAKSVNGRSKIAAIGNGTVMSNPTAAVITHVLNNKTEFPYVTGVEDLVVVSFGNGSVDESSATTARKEMVRIAANLMAETVDESVAMAFGHYASSNYVRIQSNNMKNSVGTSNDVHMLAQCNVESVMFSGKRISKLSNGEKLELFAKKLVEEEEKRKESRIPMVMVKQHATMTPPRSSSSTNLSLSSSSSSSTDSC